MAIGFCDMDIIKKPNKLLLNLEAMKIARFYESKGKQIILVDSPEQYKDFEEFYLFQNLLSSKPISLPPLVHQIGFAYTGGLYLPMPLEIEKQEPLPQVYSTYLREKVKTNKTTISQLEKLLNSNFIRFKAGDFLLDINKLTPKYGLYIYDTNIELVPDWLDKIKYCQENIKKSPKTNTIKVINGFNVSSFKNIENILSIPGFHSRDIHLTYPCGYQEFKEELTKIEPLISSRDGFKYSFSCGVNEESDTAVLKNLCLSINKYLFAKSINCGCDFIAGTYCENSIYYPLQQNLQYWSEIRVLDQSLEQYFRKRSKQIGEIYDIALKTPFGPTLKKLCNVTKKEIRESGWYYHE